MSIQQNMKDKISAASGDYTSILLDLLQEIDNNQIPKTRIKKELLEDLTEWVLEEEAGI